MVLIKLVFGPKHLIKINNYFRAVIELTLAGFIWGASFTVMRWALDDFAASTLIFWRFILAFIVGELILYFFDRKTFKNSHSDIRLSMKAGLFLGASLFFQTYGLNFTTATNSGFITSLYVVLIPLFASVLFQHKIKKRHVFLSLLAFTGMGFLLHLKNLNINYGDLLTLLAAVTAAFQIIFIGQTAPKAKSPFRYNTYQIFWSWIIILPFLGLEISTKSVSLWPEVVHFKSLASVVGLALIVSLFAFYLQVRAQRILSTTTSSMLCLLEGPFAYIFASYFLSERLNLVQAFGAFLILLSCALSVYFDKE